MDRPDIAHCTGRPLQGQASFGVDDHGYLCMAVVPYTASVARSAWRPMYGQSGGPMTDDIRAFVPGIDVRLAGAYGPLAGLTFAAKDLFDVAATQPVAATTTGQHTTRCQHAMPGPCRRCWRRGRRWSARPSPTKYRWVFWVRIPSMEHRSMRQRQTVCPADRPRVRPRR